MGSNSFKHPSLVVKLDKEEEPLKHVSAQLDKEGGDPETCCCPFTPIEAYVGGYVLFQQLGTN